MFQADGFHMRTVRRSDLETLLALNSDIAKKGRYMTWRLPSQPKLEKDFEDTGLWGDNSGTLLIVDDATQAIIGSMVYFVSCPYYFGLEIGYILYSEEHRGRGISKAALNILVDYLFKLKNINRLELKIDLANDASNRLALATGFVLEGLIRQPVLTEGDWVDINQYSLIRPDYLERKKAGVYEV